MSANTIVSTYVLHVGYIRIVFSKECKKFATYFRAINLKSIMNNPFFNSLKFTENCTILH